MSLGPHCWARWRRSPSSGPREVLRGRDPGCSAGSARVPGPGLLSEVLAGRADLIASVDRTDENALAALAMQEIYDELDPATYGVYE